MIKVCPFTEIHLAGGNLLVFLPSLIIIYRHFAVDEANDVVYLCDPSPYRFFSSHQDQNDKRQLLKIPKFLFAQLSGRTLVLSATQAETVGPFGQVGFLSRVS